MAQMTARACGYTKKNIYLRKNKDYFSPNEILLSKLEQGIFSSGEFFKNCTFQLLHSSAQENFSESGSSTLAVCAHMPQM